SLEGYSLLNNQESDNEQKNAQIEQPKAQIESSSSQYEQSSARSEQAIPKITTEITSKNTNNNLNLDQMKNYIWNLEIPISLKKDLMIWAQDLIYDSTFDLSAIEYVYNTYNHMIKPDCTSEDVWYLNKHEFTQTIKKMYHADI